MADTNFKFCAACGRKVALNAQFCAGCGADLSGGSEKILGCTDNTRTRDNTITSLVFTTNRIIVAETQSLRMELASSAVPSFAGVLLGGALRALARDKKEQEMRTSTPEEIIGAHKNNYAVPYSEITQFRVRKQTGTKMSWRIKTGRIAWATRLGVKEFKLPYYKKQKESERNLESLWSALRQGNRLGDKLIIEN